MKQYDYTDAGNAERWVETNSKVFKAVAEREGRTSKFGWLMWDADAGVWKADDDGAAVRAVLEMTEQMAAEAELALAEAEGIEDEKKREVVTSSAKALLQWSARSRSDRSVKAVLSLARSLSGMTIHEGDLDSDGELLCVANGTLDLRTGELRESRPEDFITVQVPVAYDPSASCPRWMQFTTEVWPCPENIDLRYYIRQFVGYCVTGRINAQTFHVLWGSGANGKSVFIAVLRGLLGGYIKEAAPSTFVQGRHPDPNRHGLAALKGARVVTTTEVRGDGVLDLATVKATTGGDEVTCRHLYGNFFSYVPTFKPILVCNAKPRIKEDSQGVWRRLRLVPFTESFEGDRCDPDLTRKLLAELPGIMNWALDGLKSLRSGWLVPVAIRAATNDYRADESPLATFLDERYDTSTKEWQSSAAIYAAFKKWQEERGDRPWTRRAVGNALSGHGIEAGKKGKDRTRGYYVGTLKSSPPDVDLDDVDFTLMN